MSKKIITVFGGTGAQGGGVVNALLKHGSYTVRVPSRDPRSENSKHSCRRDAK